jgi:hypothetical protein
MPATSQRRIALQDRDNFIRNLGTILDGDGLDGGGSGDLIPDLEPPVPLSDSAQGAKSSTLMIRRSGQVENELHPGLLGPTRGRWAHPVLLCGEEITA